MSENKSSPQSLSATEFFGVLVKSEIVVPEKLSSIEKQLKQAGSRITSEKLIDSLIKAGLITQWQSEKLLKGRHKGFFLGKYKLLGHLGTGGMSTVYLAQQSLTRQQRAIKVLPRKNIDERSYLPRFYREARSIAALNHPNIIRIFDVNQDDGTHYMVMEYVSGCDLYDEVIDNGPVSFDFARDCIIQSAQGLAHAHDRNLIHRDIKPANLFRTESGIVKVLDLGLALLKTEDDDHGLSKQYNESTMGTADYLAPEQAINSHQVDHRADIYGLGCTLYFLLTGQPPFNEGTLAQRIAKHQTIMPPDVSTLRTDCPASLNSICMRMMQKEPADRFSDCRELITALSEGSDWADPGNIEIRTSPSSITLPDSLNQQKPASTTSSLGNRRSKIPWLMISLLSLLLVIPITLAVILINSESESATGSNQTVSFQETAGPSEKNDSATKAKAQISTTNSNPVGQFQIDFEKSSRLAASKNSWSVDQFGIAGELRHDRHARIIDSPAKHAERLGQSVLRIRGDSEEFEFIPEDRKKSRLSRVEFQIMRESTTPTEIAIDTKSTRRFESWQEILVITDRVNSDTFTTIIVDSKDLNKVANPQKFRFRIGGTKETGLLIDHLKIELQ